MGSYDPRESLKNIEKKTCNTIISKTNIPNFSAKYAKDKEFVPPCGIYNYEKCYKSISRPMKKRC